MVRYVLLALTLAAVGLTAQGASVQTGTAATARRDLGAGGGDILWCDDSSDPRCSPATPDTPPVEVGSVVLALPADPMTITTPEAVGPLSDLPHAGARDGIRRRVDRPPQV